jgi:hypothetical protein
VGLLKNVNDSYALRKSNLYQGVQNEAFFEMVVASQDGVPQYLFVNKAYQLRFWLMTLHKKEGEHFSILELL